LRSKASVPALKAASILGCDIKKPNAWFRRTEPRRHKTIYQLLVNDSVTGAAGKIRTKSWI
jgi:hypothetical protein